MPNLNNRDFNCSGCFLCADICPVSAIAINRDEEGFYTYHIDEDTCTSCGLCVSQCPQLNQDTGNESPETCYAAYSKDDRILLESASGGLFTELARSVLRQGGLVVGAAWVDGDVRHLLVESESGLGSLRNSKYLQSDLSGIYTRIRSELEGGRTVLFSGLPCQVTALHNTVTHPNLFTIDLICFGVPSRTVFDQSVRDQFDRDVSRVNFRKKRNGWLDYYLHYDFTEGEEREVKASEDLWYQMYSEKNFLSSSCYGCKLNHLPRHGDLSLGDFWGIEQLDPEFFAANHNKGISVVIVNNPKGQLLYNRITENVVSRVEPMEMAKRYNERVDDREDHADLTERRKAFFTAFSDNQVHFGGDA